jgi:hypothetical protein
MRRIAAFACLLFGIASVASAENGIVGGEFLLIPVGARAAAMGQAFTAVPANTPDALIYNPSANAFISSNTISADYMRGFDGDGTGLFAAAVPLGRVVITPALLYYNAGTMDLNLSDGTNGSVIAEEDYVYMGAAALRMLDFLAVGGSYKSWRSTLAQTATAKGTSYDLGAMALLPYGFSAGYAVLNMGDDIKYDAYADPAPKTNRAGIAWHIRRSQFDEDPDPTAANADFDILFSGDYVKTVDEDGYYQFGSEATTKISDNSTFALRGGYMMDRDNQTITFGAGFRAAGWGFDYAYGGARMLDAVHQFSISCSF